MEKYKIKYIDIDSLQPFGKNPKKHPESQIKAVAKSIRKFGWTNPILAIIHENKNLVIAGHARLEAAKSINLKQVPVIFLDIPYEKAIAYNIADNKLAELAEWDEPLLAEILKNMDKEIISLTGFEDNEIQRLLDSIKEITEDNPPELGKEAIAKLGDIYQLGKHRIMCGDSTKKEDVDKLMDGKKADMIFTDPPYGVSYSAKNSFLNNLDKGNCIQTEIQNDMMSEIETQEFWYKYFMLVKNYLNKIHCYYIFSPQIQGMMMMMMMKAGMPYRHVLIWVKNNHVLGRTDYNYKHEPILYGWLEKSTHKFYGNGQQKFSVWNFDKPIKSDLHPTMKPIALIVNAILNSSKKDDIILDSFGGSGSTLIACEQTNRICYMMEIDPLYVDVIIKRFEIFTGLKAQKIL